jgi:protein tyrosine phosphatase (PTP) superfamily phosphohydrolase (DUF442 family)
MIYHKIDRRVYICIIVMLPGLLIVPSASGQRSPGEGAATVPERLELPGIENAFRVGPRVYSGGEPRGSEAFAALKDLGVRTIITVDGATPDVEAARALGLRYVHIPIGYDGVPRAQAARLIQAVKTLPGPLYVHCHHGKHRGPAAVGVCGLALEGWTEEQAIRWMETAGTSPDYRGLYASARNFVPPSDEELKQAGADLPERAPVPDLVALMIRVDAQWDRLKAIQQAGLKAPADQPDLDPPHEALQLAELFREMARTVEAKDRGRAFLAKAKAADDQASDLGRALRAFDETTAPEGRSAVESAFQGVARACTNCHAGHRDKS